MLTCKYPLNEVKIKAERTISNGIGFVFDEILILILKCDTLKDRWYLY